MDPNTADSSTPDYEITTDQSRFDLDLIHGFLAATYWAKNIPREVVECSVRNSLAFAILHGRRQVGFARVITDYATFGYLGDVFVVPEYRGRGLSKRLMREILAHPQLQGLRRLLLATQDAHGLYAQFGFMPLAQPDHFMTIHRPNVYQAGTP